MTSAFATSICGEEPLLPNTVAHLLRQQGEFTRPVRTSLTVVIAWILQEAGSAEDCEQLLLQAKNLSADLCTKASWGNVALLPQLTTV